jgi:hypothetical protein
MMRDSASAICMHGDGRLFIRTAEKDWGLMRLTTGHPLTIRLDFERAVVTFELRRTIRGKEKETIAEVPGLFAEATVAVCFGGREQKLSIAKWTQSSSAGGASKVARDPFVEAMGAPVERLSLQERDAGASVDAEVAAVASTMW